MKSTLVFSIPRMRSTIIYRLLFEYAKKKYLPIEKTKWLNYYFDETRFNKFYLDNKDQHNRFLNRKHCESYVEGSYREIPRVDPGNYVYLTRLYKNSIIPKELIKRETKRRADMLLAYPEGRYFIKEHAATNANTYLPIIKDHFDIVCMKREDELTQLLEYFLSLQTGYFQSFDRSAYSYPEKYSIRLEEYHIAGYASRRNLYIDWVSKLENKIVVDYNSVSTPQSTYKALGLHDWSKWVSISEIRLPVEPLYTEIETYFSNLDQIKDWVEKYFT